MTPEQKIEDSELIKQIAWMAWKGAANAYRLYPDNNHTFTDYWAGAESQFEEFKKLIAGRSKGLEREKGLEDEIADLKRQLDLYETDKYDKDDEITRGSDADFG